MLDISYFRDENLFKKILESEKKRGKSEEFAQNVKKYDDLWKSAKLNEEEKRALKNKITKQIPLLAKMGEDITNLRNESKTIDEEILELAKMQKDYLQLRDENRYLVGNILFDDVPLGDESSAKVVRVHGTAKVQKEHIDNFNELIQGHKMDMNIMNFIPQSHSDLGPKRDLFDLERAAKISGSRFYFLKGKLAILHMAILRFAMDKLFQKNYTPIYTPFIINLDVMKKAAELSDFEESLYKVGDDQILIATAEQTLASMHMDEILDKNDLPIKYAGFSSAFRKEAGSSGKDTRGIFRVHQFDKIEQYVLCLEEDSKKLHEEMISTVEEIMQDLELSYRVVIIPSKDMNDTAAKKYDVELWMPVQGTFREIASGSITTDYQTRKLNVRYEDKGERLVVHSLNCTAVPSPRILTAIIENHQDANGTIHIPKALQKYTGFDKI